ALNVPTHCSFPCNSKGMVSASANCCKFSSRANHGVNVCASLLHASRTLTRVSFPSFAFSCISQNPLSQNPFSCKTCRSHLRNRSHILHIRPIISHLQNGETGLLMLHSPAPS